MAHVKGKVKKSEEIREMLNRIIAGSDAKAERVLREIQGYEPIPGVNAMTANMVARFCGKSYVSAKDINTWASRYGLNKIARKGKWEGKGEPGVICISDCLKKAGMDVDQTEAMKFCGIKAANARLSLYTAKGILALLYAGYPSRDLVEAAVKRNYRCKPRKKEQKGLVPAPSTPVSEVVGSVELPVAVSGLTPEFVAELVRVCVRESLNALLQRQTAG